MQRPVPSLTTSLAGNRVLRQVWPATGSSLAGNRIQLLNLAADLMRKESSTGNTKTSSKTSRHLHCPDLLQKQIQEVQSTTQKPTNFFKF